MNEPKQGEIMRDVGYWPNTTMVLLLVDGIACLFGHMIPGILIYYRSWVGKGTREIKMQISTDRSSRLELRLLLLLLACCD